MLSKKEILSINELQPGMIASSDIYFEGKILVGKGIHITESIIEKLKKNYIIDKAEVYSGDESEISANRIKTAKEFESIINEFSSNLENIFDNISTLKVQGIDEVRSFSRRIQEEFKTAGTGAVIRNVAFYGSGNDTIYKHSVNVAAISFILGKWLEFDEKELNLMTYAAILHDLGKTKIDKGILSKKGNLSTKEYEIFKTHPIIGYNLVKQIPYLDACVSYAVLMHHERMDGSGYPLHIKEEKIHKFAKIIAIADLFDDVSSNRYSKKIKGLFEALEVIQDDSLTKLDYNYCTVFLKHIVDYYMGENVLLNDKRSCKIVRVEMNDLTKPLLLDNGIFLDLKKEKNLHVERLII